MTEAEKQRLKDRILSEFYQLPLLRKKVDGILFRNHCKRETLLYEDLMNEAFYHICKKSPDEIIDMWTNGGRQPEGTWSRLTGIFVTIAVLKGVTKNSRGYPKHSLLSSVSFASTLFQHEHISPTEADEEKEFNQILAADDNEPDADELLWTLIRSNLTEEETETLDWYLAHKKRPGRYRQDTKKKLDHLKNRIKEIVTENKIRI